MTADDHHEHGNPDHREEARTAGRTLLIVIAVMGAAVLGTLGLTTYAIVKVIDASASQAQIAHSDARIRRNQALIHHVAKAQQLAIREGCDRLNIQRVLANRVYASDYKIAKIFFIAVSAKRPPSSPPQTRQQRRLTRRFLRIERAALDAYEWTPLTNCSRAVNEQGVRYRSPKPVRFTARRPPKSALGEK